MTTSSSSCRNHIAFADFLLTDPRSFQDSVRMSAQREMAVSGSGRRLSLRLMEIVSLRPELHLIKPAFGQSYS